MTSSTNSWIGAVGFAALWAMVASSSPTTTFHLAPAIIAAWPAATGRRRTRLPALAALGFVLAGATTMALWSAGWLQGPSLLPIGGPITESLIGVAFGVGIGSALAMFGSTVAQQGPDRG